MEWALIVHIHFFDFVLIFVFIFILVLLVLSWDIVEGDLRTLDFL